MYDELSSGLFAGMVAVRNVLIFTQGVGPFGVVQKNFYSIFINFLKALRKLSSFKVSIAIIDNSFIRGAPAKLQLTIAFFLIEHVSVELICRLRTYCIYVEKPET